MEKDDLIWLRTQRQRLVLALATIDEALEALPPMTRHTERARLTGEMQALQADLSAVNTRLSSLRTLACCEVAAAL